MEPGTFTEGHICTADCERCTTPRDSNHRVIVPHHCARCGLSVDWDCRYCDCRAPLNHGQGNTP